MSTYTDQAQEFITKHGLEFRAVLIGDDCPTFCTDAEKGIDMDKVNVFPRKTHIHGKHYRCTFSRKEKGHFAVDFWNSYADEKHNHDRKNFTGSFAYESIADRIKRTKQPAKTPQPYDVLACIMKYDPGTFEDFCSDFGYDTDSRKAETIYWAVVKEFRSMERFFTAEEMAELQEIN